MLMFAIFFSALFASTPESLTYIVCKNRNIVRTIQVEWLADEDRCSTTYTKAGNPQEVGSARNRSHCLSISTNIKNNLISAGWSCEEVSKKIHVISND